MAVKKICKRCGVEFSAVAGQTQYCPDCKSIRHIERSVAWRREKREKAKSTLLNFKDSEKN